MRLIAALFLMLAAASMPGALPVAAPSPDDDAIHDLVRQRLYNDPDVKGHNIDIQVRGGVVTLSGTVTSEKIRAKAEKITRKVSGVKKVVNHLRVGREKPV